MQDGGGIPVKILYSSHVATVQLLCGYQTSPMWLPHSFHVAATQFMCGSCTATIQLTVADPGFPRGGGANPKGGGTNLLFGQFSPPNCMKMKKFWARGGAARSSRPPSDLPLAHVWFPHSSCVAHGQLLCGSHTAPM